MTIDERAHDLTLEYMKLVKSESQQPSTPWMPAVITPEAFVSKYVLSYKQILAALKKNPPTNY